MRNKNKNKNENEGEKIKVCSEVAGREWREA